MGRAAELRVSLWLRERGWYVIPSYDYSGDGRNKAPRLQGIADAFPVPDLDVCRKLPGRNPERRWVEVKAKQAATFTHKTGTYDHGIEHYDDYMRVAELTGTEPWLVVVEIATIRESRSLWGERGRIWMQSFARLGEPRRTGMFGKRMAYWPIDNFERDMIDLDEAV